MCGYMCAGGITYVETSQRNDRMPAQPDPCEGDAATVGNRQVEEQNKNCEFM